MWAAFTCVVLFIQEQEESKTRDKQLARQKEAEAKAKLKDLGRKIRVLNAKWVHLWPCYMQHHAYRA